MDAAEVPVADDKIRFPQRMARIVAEIVVAVYVVADTIVFTLFRPIVRFLSRLRIVQRLERLIASMHPYVILVVMVVPFIIAELAKVFAVFWMSEGHFRTGMTIFIGAYVVSIFVCERILHAGKDQLMTIRWFAVTYTWIMSIRDAILDWFRGTAIWKAAVALKDRARAAIRHSAARLRSAFGMDKKREFRTKPRFEPNRH